MLHGHFKDVNRSKKSAFEAKYGAGILEIKSTVLSKHGIRSDSTLASIIENTIRKFLVGIEERQKAYAQWHSQHASQFPKLKGDYGSAYHGNVALMLKFNQDMNLSSAEFSKFARIDMGRSNAVLTAHRLITRHRKDLSDKTRAKERDPSLAVIGTVIRGVLDLYYEQNGKSMKVMFSQNPVLSQDVLQSYLGIAKPKMQKN